MNQLAQNGQLRAASDHLGSGTLLIDTSTPPQVISRQYHKPYGGVAWQGGGTPIQAMTTIGYTGQRLDTDSGLIFYNARMYDPVLSYFVQADSIVPDVDALTTNLQAPRDAAGKGTVAQSQYLNRYTYVLNDPLTLVDPTGHKPAPPGTTPIYYQMLGITYTHMMSTIGATRAAHPTFEALRSLNGLASDLLSKPAGYIEGWINKGLAAKVAYDTGLLWANMVQENGEWDMKSVISKTLRGKDHMSPADDIWFHLPGTHQGVETNFNLFGNIWYGFVGAAAGFGLGTLLAGAVGADAANYGLEGVNLKDLAAVNVGYSLWENFGFNLTAEQMHRAILEHARVGNTHTRCRVGVKC